MSRRLVTLAALAALVLAGCSSGTNVDGAAETPARATAEYPLPFGLEQVEGTTAVARPAVAEQVTSLYNGQPAKATSLRAAYRVTGSPQKVVTAWSEQFADLGFGDIEITTPSMLESDGPSPWLELSAYSNGPPASYANAELWSTDAEPLLLIEIDHSPDTASRFVAAPEIPPLPAEPAPVPAALVSEGDAVFGPEGAEVHLPPGAEQVMPRVPSVSGTFGEVVMLTTDDPRTAVQAMVQAAYDHNEAQPQHEPGSIDGPHETVVDGSMTITAEFNSGPGGWGFSVVASHTSDDDLASVWIRTYAD